MILTCKHCGQPGEHRARSDNGKPVSRCNDCLAAYTRSWRKANWQRRKAYDTWKGMIRRCYDKTTRRWWPGTGVPSYRDYGELGITVCSRWRGEDGFEKFVKDLGLPPTKDVTLDRKRPTRSYCPSNCRWADKKTQDQNRRNAVWVTARVPGTTEVLTLCLSEWGRRTGIDRRTIGKRLKRGWDQDRAVNEPVADQLEAAPF